MRRGDIALVLPLAAALALVGCGLDLATHGFGDTVPQPISRVDVRATTGPVGSTVVWAPRSGDHHQR